MHTETFAWLQLAVFIAQTIVLLLTAIWILRYTKATEKLTIETVALRKETVRQTKISLRPIVLPQFNDQLRTPEFTLRNCGNGCAVNVNVTPIRIDQYKHALGIIELRTDFVDYLPSGGDTIVRAIPHCDDKRWTGAEFDFYLSLAYSGPETTVEITFGDIEGLRYRVQATISAYDSQKARRKVKVGAIEEIKG